MLTQNQIKYQLQIGNCCGAKKVNTYIENMKAGKFCPELLAEANLLFGFIDSLRCYNLYDTTPKVIVAEYLETEIFQIDNATFLTAAGWLTAGNSLELIIYNALTGLTIDVPYLAAGGFLTLLQTEALYVRANATILGYTNTNYRLNPPGTPPLTFSFIQQINDCDTPIAPDAIWGFDLHNITLDQTLSFHDTMLGNSVCEVTIPTYPYHDCIAYEQVLNILAAIKRICNGACTDYVNFQLN